MRRTTYNRDLYQNAYIKINWYLPMIKRAIETGEGVTTKEPLSLCGYDYTLSYYPILELGGGGFTLTLNWEDEGDPYSQTIPILQEESNLVRGSYVYYFLSPHGFKSRVLFYIGNSFRSRRTFYHLYRSQRESKLKRALSYLSMEQPYKRYGKEFYRGQLTPYGRRCQRYEEQQETGLGAMIYLTYGIHEKATKNRFK